MPQVVAGFKRWVARHGGVQWQSDFFEHRIRGWESAQEKRTYILNNPVRAGLVAEAADWPYQVGRDLSIAPTCPPDGGS